MKKISYSIVIALLLHIATNHCADDVTSQQAVFIFDLDGVLIEQSGFSCAWNIGFTNFFGLYNPYNIKKKMFEFFDVVVPRKAETPWAYNGNLLLPQLMCDWLMGEKTNQEILALVKQALIDKKHLFDNKNYHTLTGKIAEFMFTPKKLVAAMRPIKDGVQLLKSCKEKNHLVFILSNWDKESFPHLRQQEWFKEILHYCDGYIISGHVQLMKPDPRIFEHFFDAYQIDADTTLTVYIDDTRENLLGARTLNKKQLVCIECQNKNFEPIYAELQKLSLF